MTVSYPLAKFELDFLHPSDLPQFLHVFEFSPSTVHLLSPFKNVPEKCRWIFAVWVKGSHQPPPFSRWENNLKSPLPLLKSSKYHIRMFLLIKPNNSRMPVFSQKLQQFFELSGGNSDVFLDLREFDLCKNAGTYVGGAWMLHLNYFAIFVRNFINPVDLSMVLITASELSRIHRLPSYRVVMYDCVVYLISTSHWYMHDLSTTFRFFVRRIGACRVIQPASGPRSDKHHGMLGVFNSKSKRYVLSSFTLYAQIVKTPKKSINLEDSTGGGDEQASYQV